MKVVNELNAEKSINAPAAGRRHWNGTKTTVSRGFKLGDRETPLDYMERWISLKSSPIAWKMLSSSLLLGA